MFDSDISSFFLDHKNIYINTTVSLFTKIIAAKDLVCQKDDLYCNYCAYLSISTGCPILLGPLCFCYFLGF